MLWRLLLDTGSIPNICLKYAWAGNGLGIVGWKWARNLSLHNMEFLLVKFDIKVFYLLLIRIVLLGVPKKQGAQVRKLVDYVVYTNTSNTQLNNVSLPSSSIMSCCHGALCFQVAIKFNELVWKYNFICLDRLVLCMVSACMDHVTNW